MGVTKFLINKFMLKKWEEEDNKRLLNYKYPESIKQILDIDYAGDKHKGHLLDILYPLGVKKLPVIIEIHGGGFLYGYKEKNRPYCCQLAMRGFIVFSLNYRLALNDTDILGQIKDVLTAINWINDNLNKFPADKENISIIGDSAGGFLAAMAALIIKNERLQKIFDTVNPDIDIKGVGLNCGLMNIEYKKLAYRGLRSMCLNKGYKKQDYYYNMIFENIPEMKDFPKTFLTTGDEDELNYMSLNFEKILKKFSIKYKLRYFEKKEGINLGHVFSVNFSDSKDGQILIDEMSEFFKENADKI